MKQIYHGIEEAANLAYTSKLMEDTNLKDVSMAEVVSQLQTEGYNIYSKQSSEGSITGIKLDSNSLSISKEGTASINVTYEGKEEGMEYYAVVKGKYYLMTKTDKKIKVSREATDVSGSGTEKLEAKSENETYVQVEEISGNTIKLKAGNTIGTTTITVTYGSFTETCTVSVVTTPTEGSEENTEISFATDYGTIDIIWLNEDNTISSTPNEPVLESNGEKMTPVTWTYDESSKTWKEDETTNSNWYNYNGTGKRGTDGKLEDNRQSQWANAKTANGSYFVWIPRYAYRITYYSSETSTEPTGYYDGWGMWKNDGTLKYKIDEAIETVEYKGNKYIVHPAFCDGRENEYANGEWDSELPGFWFAKYEMSGSSDLKSEPNLICLREMSIGDQYVKAREAKYGYTGTETKITSGGTEYTHTNFMDSHLVKNSEWGAVAYLTQSQYGRNGNVIAINNSSPYITGNGGGSPNASVSETTNAYNTEVGAKASTTGNIYGIYDMSGGAYDRAAGYDKLGSSSYLTSSTYGLNMIQEAKDANGSYTSTKYVTAYENGTSSSANNAYNVCKIGDAIKEVRTGNDTGRAWFSDYSYFARSGLPFFKRGGAYNNGSYAGVFCSYYNNGTSSSYSSFRAVLCP